MTFNRGLLAMVFGLALLLMLREGWTLSAYLLGAVHMYLSRYMGDDE